jgi:3'(2'), 5'-bisphosphate nucleotidase
VTPWAAPGLTAAPRIAADTVAAVTFEPGTPPADAATDDHVLATWLATVAGERLLEVRGEGLEGRELKDAGDLAAHDLLMKLLAEHRPDDSVLSEEALEKAADKAARLSADRVWIVDPLDGTREFSEIPREDWAVHVALWSGGDLVAGAVAQPALGQTFNTGQPPVVPPSTSERPRIAVSRSRPPAFVTALAEELDAELVPMGSAGVKVISVARDISDAYVHAGGQYEWDSAAPVAVARAAGLFTSRVDGTPLVYNQEDVYLPDLIVCRPELAEQIVAFVKRHGIS